MAYWSEKAVPLDSHISVYSRPRPLRVAYLIDESEHWSQTLDAVIAEAYGRWAGSRTLLVPVLDGEIDPPYWDWLRWWDPDLIYSYPLLKPETAQNISRQIAPGWFVGHKTFGPATDPFDPTPRSHVQSLSSRSVLPFLRTPRGFQREIPTKLVNKFPQWRDDGFISDNFGTDEGTFRGFPMIHAVRQMIEPLNLIPVDAPANRYHFGEAGPEIGSVSELLKLMARDHTIVTMCDLASWAPTGVLSLTRHNAEHLKGIRGHQWSLTFNLVVGDGFKERISFWNARLVQPAWRAAGYLAALRVPQKSLSDSEFVESLATFLKSRKWALAPGQDHHRITIRFGSTAESEFKPLADKLRSELLCMVVLEPLAKVSDVCPKREQMEHDLPIRDEWPQYVSATIAQVDMPRPFHIAELPITSVPNLVDGIWMVDHKIDRHNNHSTYSNIRHWWRVPRRIGVARLFVENGCSCRITASNPIPSRNRATASRDPSSWP